MKIRTTVTEIEATAEELRQSNSLADSFQNVLRGVMNPMLYTHNSTDEEDEAADEND